MTNKDSSGPASDRELLEMAAKAAGVSVVRGYFGCGECWLTEKAGFGLTPWNPLTDDGDALRLSYYLGLDVDMCACWVQYEGDEEMESIEFIGGSLENVRRAIVRAAAAIGGAM